MSSTRRAAYSTNPQVAGSAQCRSSKNHTVARSTAASSTTSRTVSYTTGRSTSGLATDPRASSGNTAANASTRPPAAAHKCGADRRAARNESANAEYQTPSSPGDARPVMSWIVRRSRRERSSSHSRVFPIPASPRTTSTRPRPSCAPPIASSAASSCCVRPTSGISRLGIMTARTTRPHRTRVPRSGLPSPDRGYDLLTGP
jgi:hypothetical protein